jgi:hypothetical protein
MANLQKNEKSHKIDKNNKFSTTQKFSEFIQFSKTYHKKTISTNSFSLNHLLSTIISFLDLFTILAPETTQKLAIKFAIPQKIPEISFSPRNTNNKAQIREIPNDANMIARII